MSSDGPLVVLDEIGSAGDALGSSVALVDLSQRSWRPLAQATPGYHPWTPVIRGDTVAWVEWKYASPSFSGACSWRVVGMSLSSGKSRTIATGTSARLQGAGGPPPPLALDGTQLAYAVQDTSTGRPFGWQIRVLDIATGHIQRTIETASEIYGLGLSNGAVAYSEGLVDEARGFVYKTKLMLSTPEQPAPHQLAPDAFELSFRDGRLAWTEDPTSSQEQGGRPAAPRVWTAAGPDWHPVAVADEPSDSAVQQEWPAASKLGVSFTAMDPTNPNPDGLVLWFWDPANGQAKAVSGSEGTILSSQGSGWLTYAGALGDSVTVSGTPWP
jgi:hypothetical protein